MSQLLRFLIGLICIACLASNVAAQGRWRLVGMTPDSAVWLIDKSVIKKSSGVIQAWEKVIYRDGSYSIALNEWKCSEKMKRLMQVNHYDPSGDYLSRSLTPLSWRYVVPDSIEEKTYKIICRPADNKENNTGRKKQGVTNSSIAQIIVKKANLMSEADPKSKVVRRLVLGQKLVLLSNDSIGVWYRVADPKTNLQGWLNGNEFRIVNAKVP